jgi:hypothetical protein
MGAINLWGELGRLVQIPSCDMMEPSAFSGVLAILGLGGNKFEKTWF